MDDGDGLISLYDDAIVALLDSQVPLTTTRPVVADRPMPGIHDEECRSAKRSLRSLERAARRSGLLSDSTSPSVPAWRTERRRYFNLVRRRRSEFWTANVAAEQSRPRRLWRSFDQLLGRGRAPPASIDASVLYQFFDDKVAGVRAATADAAAPQYTAAPVGCEQ